MRLSDEEIESKAAAEMKLFYGSHNDGPFNSHETCFIYAAKWARDQQPKWVNANERLPEKEARVIVWENDFEDACEGYNQDGIWFDSCGYRINVSHWQSLPVDPCNATRSSRLRETSE